MKKSPSGIPVTAFPVATPEQSLKVHGTVLYNFTYRSYLDTPFAQTGLVQHQVLTRLNFTVKNKYPFQIEIGMRNSNSPYFKNNLDVNVTYIHRQLIDNIKDVLIKRMETSLDVASRSETEKRFRKHLQEAHVLEQWINSPTRAQELVEEKERGNAFVKSELNIPSISGTKNLNADDFEELSKARNYLKQTIRNKSEAGNLWKSLEESLIDSSIRKPKGLSQNKLANDSINKDAISVAKKIHSQKEELKILKTIIKTEENKIRESKKMAQDSLNNLKREINNLNSTSSLYGFMKRNGMSKDSLTKIQKALLAVNQVGIGRIFLDYSELTVKNISVTGVNIEANPGNFYFAAAAGKVNYRFRDFTLKNNDRTPPQSLSLIRAGIGSKERNHLILSFYNGKKNEMLAPSISYGRASNKVLGISAEAKWAFDANNYVITEVAKSSYNNLGAQQANSNLLNKALDLKTHTNEAFSIKLFSQYPATNTRITAYYRKMGEDFQSFNLYPSHVNEEAWMVKINQSFWKRTFTIEAAVRKNDFQSPIAAPSSFSAKTIFKSVQATLRVRKYPFVSIGYYPTSQLSFTNNNVLVENQYNTLNTIVSHSYQIKKIPMNTTIVFTEFFNNSTDTGFIYFNAKNFSLNHSVFILGFTSQSGISFTDQKLLHLMTVEETIGCKVKNNLSLNGGIKWNKLNRNENLWGGTAGMSVFIKTIGTFQLNYDKTFLPGYNRVLMPVDMGRMSFYKIF